MIYNSNFWSIVQSQFADRPPVVYLAGGFKSGWQDVIVKQVPELLYIDPRSHGLKSKYDYTIWDTRAIRQSDIVFAYFESTNPGGYNLAFEVGFAHALQKTIILVDQTPPEVARYIGMTQAVAHVELNSLADGICILQKIVTFYYCTKNRYHCSSHFSSRYWTR